MNTRISLTYLAILSLSICGCNSNSKSKKPEPTPELTEKEQVRAVVIAQTTNRDPDSLSYLSWSDSQPQKVYIVGAYYKTGKGQVVNYLVRRFEDKEGGYQWVAEPVSNANRKIVALVSQSAGQAYLMTAAKDDDSEQEPDSDPTL